MQKEQIEELSFKKRARRRLVGAIALVLLMIVVLPMLLEDREKTAQEDIEITMPPPEMEASAEPSAENLSGIEEATDELPSEAVASPPEAEAAPGDAIKTVKIETEKSEEAVKEAPKVNADGNNDSGRYYVQIGVFANTGNIKKLQAKLSELGYRSLTEKITTETGVKTRLRTESFVGRNEAAIALQNIKDAGLAGMVVSQK